MRIRFVPLEKFTSDNPLYSEHPILQSLYPVDKIIPIRIRFLIKYRLHEIEIRRCLPTFTMEYL